MSATRKLNFLFDEGNPYHAVTSFVDTSTCKDHLAAGLNGANGAAITALLEALIQGHLDPLTQDDTMKALWVSAGFKPEHLLPGCLAIVATGRGFGFAKQSKLPISQGKVVSDSAMVVKQMVWDFLKTDTRHLNEREIAAAKVATVAKEPAKPATKPAKAKPAKKPAKPTKAVAEVSAPAA